MAHTPNKNRIQKSEPETKSFSWKPKLAEISRFTYTITTPIYAEPNEHTIDFSKRTLSTKNLHSLSLSISLTYI